MADTLSQAQIAKYAARLQGQRLLPVLQEWQIKRAICRLAADGSTHALDAIKRGVEKGVLSKPPYSALLEFVLVGSVSPANAQRVRAHLRPPEPSKQPESPPRPQRDWSSGADKAAPAQSPVKAEPESFSTTNNPIQLLREQLKASAPLDSYRSELGERVRQDNSRKLLQEICELWDRSVGSQKETLYELIAFIELVPERPLWLRRNVALDCGMPWHLADDSPAIAEHLVDTIQLRTRKPAIISACRKLRREDTKTEICELWFAQYKKGLHDKDFDDVLLQLGFLPKEPVEQRVAIALTCGWAERLAYDDTEVLVFLLPLLDHPRLGGEARRALKNIKNPSTLNALEEQRVSAANKKQAIDAEQQKENDSSFFNDEAAEARAHRKDKQEKIDSKQADRLDALDIEASQRTKEKDEPLSVLRINRDNDREEERPSHLDKWIDAPEILRDPHFEPLGSPSPNPYLDFRHDAQLDDDGEDITLGTVRWDDASDPDSQWISKLDRLAGLSPEERQKIIATIANSTLGCDDWISELLSDDNMYFFQELRRPQRDQHPERANRQTRRRGNELNSDTD